MKRMKWIIVSLLLVFFLSSCDLLSSEDVEEYTESYCQENPNSEICKGSFIEDLNNTTIETLFWDVYEQEEEEDFCDEYISLSNTELVDACNHQLDFFPQDIDDFDNLEIEQEADNQKNTITATLSQNEHSIKYVFTIILVYINDQILIEEWLFEEQQPTNEAMYTAMLEEWAEAEDEDVFCAEWFVQIQVPDCKELFNKSKDEGFIFILNEYVTGSPEDNVKLLTNNDVPVQYEFYVTFQLEDSMNKIEQSLVTDPTDEYQPILNQFILGLNSVSLSDAEVCGPYVELESYDLCVLKRQEIINDSLSVSLERFEWKNETTKAFEIDIRFTADDFTYVDTVEGFFYLDDDTIMMEIPLQYELSRHIRASMLNILVNNMNDADIDIMTVVAVINDAETEAFIISLRDYMFEHELTIDSHEVTFGSTYFEFT